MASTTLRDYLQHTEDAIDAGHIEDALAHCQRVLSHFPDSLEAQRLLGEVYLAQGHLEDAQQTFDWILVNDPENVVVYCDRALICERKSDLDTALDCYQQAYELSRGNGQIRQEFNKLSAKAGQQGFMFSRAGLARLYMRGDLLPQAIQEWEAVLSANPDRLDARTGLLEAYWREGLYEQVEELASALLNDVPGCLKALLLFAHVSSMKNVQQAQELLQRAEVLDPEMVMAQELFSDLIASQPHDPFLQLLKKGPVMLAEQTAPHLAAMTAPSQTESPVHTNGSHGSQITPTFSDSPLSSWSNLDTLMDAQPQSEPESDLPTFAWSSNSALDINPWSTIDQLTSNNDVPLAEPEEELQPEVAHEANIPAAESTEEELDTPQAWHQAEQFSEPEAETFGSWSSMSNVGTETSESLWGSEVHEETARSAPPAWLDMLTKGERRPTSQSSGSSVPAASTAPLAESEPVVEVPPTQQVAEPPTSDYVAWEDSTLIPTLDEENGDEASFFGPEWLKSLGATVIEGQNPATQSEPHMPAMIEKPEKSEESEDLTLPGAVAPSSASDYWQEPAAESWVNQLTEAVPQQQTPIDPWQDQTATYGAEAHLDWQMPIDPWLAQLEQPETYEPPVQAPPSFQTQQLQVDPWMNAATTPAQETSSATPQSQYTNEEALETLEILERELYAQGFVPLAPGSLATIAEEETLSPALPQQGSFEPQEPQPVNQIQPEQPSEAVQSVSPVQPTKPAQVAQPAVPFSEPVEEPLWLPTPIIAPARSVSEPGPVPVARVETSAQLQPQHKQPAAEPITATTPQLPIAPKTPAAGTTRPAIGNDILLDDELEMTMRRPVVRLQPVAKPVVSHGHATPVSRGRTSATSKTGNNNLSDKERLLKGYHYQLAGDYDEAMQEYRIIIRNAPELLGEVISNMRALLKLAPKYAPGYRVLGDAYMRLGEYLQAMEAYNKALTMAKKGQGTR